ncbi:nuclear transport factor 2 family protein [Segetibacter aerophilus]|uniref:SnoaL-like domain-containing protein n=1 Tax=Segetibacter aerophilus TaxID=670293 RepID=A0A512BJK3_9BACT|nr:nuclear transport factor 2 family protein [Segetibacter aerophilus]GEO12149.1 hypothetical protein SAE01_46450 [Segetibacter aerophilus]
MKKYLRTFLSLGLCLSFSYSFSKPKADTAKANREAFATFNDYLAAYKENDMSKAISYFSNSKDFLILANGKAFNSEEFTASVRQFSPQIKKHVLWYDTIYIRNIDTNAVLIMGPLRESVTDTNDRQFELNVTASIMMLKREGQWKIAYVTQVVQPISN